MATVAYSRSSLSISDVFGTAFGAIRSNPLVFLGICLLLNAIPSLLITWFQARIGFGAPASFFLSKGGLTLFACVFLVGMFFNMLVTGALVQATVDSARGERATFGACLAVGLRAAIPLFVLSILLVLGCYAAMVLLIVPGVMLYCMWAVAAPALVNERLGIFEAFGRSRFLTKGARWKILLVEIVVLVSIGVISNALWSVLRIMLGSASTMQAMLQVNRHGLPVGFVLANVLVTTILIMVWSAVQNALYVELKAWKDGAAPARLEEVFA